ncbi:MAG: winged helix-turn-helix domain-containing protein [Proteobacteria bacterium]|nr:winged helix-turn-helix domain-containing protein [Pseudomonadota bacterium]
MLHRHGWRKVIPHLQHPKADKEKQEEFKKTSGACGRGDASPDNSMVGNEALEKVRDINLRDTAICNN